MKSIHTPGIRFPPPWSSPPTPSQAFRHEYSLLTCMPMSSFNTRLILETQRCHTRILWQKQKSPRILPAYIHPISPSFSPSNSTSSHIFSQSGLLFSGPPSWLLFFSFHPPPPQHIHTSSESLTLPGPGKARSGKSPVGAAFFNATCRSGSTRLTQ